LEWKLSVYFIEAGMARYQEGLADRVKELENENKRKTEEYEVIATAHSDLKKRYEDTKADNEKLKSVCSVSFFTFISVFVFSFFQFRFTGWFRFSFRFRFSVSLLFLVAVNREVVFWFARGANSILSIAKTHAKTKLGFQFAAICMRFFGISQNRKTFLEVQPNGYGRISICFSILLLFAVFSTKVANQHAKRSSSRLTATRNTSLLFLVLFLLFCLLFAFCFFRLFHTFIYTGRTSTKGDDFTIAKRVARVGRTVQSS
jgi:hypothetical protein